MIDREIKRALRISIVTGVILSVVVQPLLNYLSLLLVTTRTRISGLGRSPLPDLQGEQVLVPIGENTDDT
jgi:hypothetical protein